MPTSQNSAQPKLTVAIIVRDAEQILPQTLQTAIQLADEIIVCDTGSVDCSCEIARRHGVKVVEHCWQDSFADARNAAWNAASGEWVLWLDAGETMTTDHISALKAFIQQQANPQRAYLLAIVVPPMPGSISGEQVAKIRLVPNRKDLRFSGRVRETLKPAIAQTAIELDGLPWRILRSQHDNHPQINWNKAVRNLSLLEKSLIESGQSPELLVAFGEAMTTTGDGQGALACFKKAVQESTSDSAVQREAYYGLLTTLDSEKAQRQQQVAVCLEALERFPLDAQLLCAMGGYMQSDGRLDMAIRAYQTAVEYGQIDPELWHVPDIFEIAAACLSLAHQMLSNDAAAEKVLVQALRKNPDATRVRRCLIDLFVKQDRRKEALDAFEFLPQDTPNREALRSAIRGACLASRQNWTPALAYLQTAFRSGCQDVLCLRWLTAALMATGDHAAAKEVIAVWLKAEPRSTEAREQLAQLGNVPDVPTSANLGDRSLRFDPAANVAAPPALAPNFTTASKINVYGPRSKS